jgi:phage minor structural protein
VGGMMFVFFDMADHPLFTRDDMESATWSVDQMSLQATFPFKADKEILRGMRVGFPFDGAWQVFEIRKIRNYEPDHYQEMTAEHIAISELTDEVFEGEDVTNQTAAATLAPMLTGTLWEVGTVTDSGLSSVDVSIGNVWTFVRNIEQNWNVLITPRITVDSTGITGRYLDIAPNAGIWRGVRLSLEKNADDLGVTWDDTDVKTALYAYGAETDGVKLTFKDQVWEPTADHPAKPAGQTYLEDPDAKALYGRDGRNRWGYYQNSSIKDAGILLEKTWESLKTLNTPKVTINCTVRDLHRLGYADQDIRLHDKVVVEIRPQNKTLVLDVIKLDIDLLNPTSTRPTIGAYIPNIVYIDHEAMDKARGGRGGTGPDNAENQIFEFETQITHNGEQIALEAYQRQLIDGQLSTSILENASAINISATGIASLCTGTGAQLDANGHLMVDQNGNPIFVTTGGGLYSKIDQNKEAIKLKVDKGEVSTELAVECGNVTITGGNLVVAGMITADGLTTMDVTVAALHAGYISVNNGGIVLDDTGDSVTASSYTMNDYNGDLVDSIKDVQIVAVANTNNYKLQYKTFKGNTWTDAGTFSRASSVSSVSVTGISANNWQSGSMFTLTLKVTLDDGTESTHTIPLNTDWAASARDDVTSSYCYKAIGEISGSLQLTANNLTASRVLKITSPKADGVSETETQYKVHYSGTTSGQTATQLFNK